MDPIIVTVVVASIFVAAWVWESLKNWATSMKTKITDWLRKQRSTFWTTAAIRIDKAWAFCWDAYENLRKIIKGLTTDFTTWLWTTVVQESAKFFALWQESTEEPPRQVKDTIREKGVYSIEV